MGDLFDVPLSTLEERVRLLLAILWEIFRDMQQCAPVDVEDSGLAILWEIFTKG